MHDLKFAFACQSKTKNVSKKMEPIFQDKYNYSPRNYPPDDFGTVY